MLNLLSAPTSAVQLSSFLAQLPVLTHFAAFCEPDRGDFAVAARDILTACKALRVFVLNPIYWRTNSEFPESLPSMDDVRFVYLNLGFRNSHLWDGWVFQTRGGIDFWARADAFVAKKGRGEIQPGSSHPIGAATFNLSSSAQLLAVGSSPLIASPSSIVCELLRTSNEIQPSSFVLIVPQ
jgi:hypothetical protein